jgi:hypothetical protein
VTKEWLVVKGIKEKGMVILKIRMAGSLMEFEKLIVPLHELRPITLSVALYESKA